MSDGVVIVAVHRQQAAAIRGDMDRAAPDAHRRHRESAQLPERSIVIAGDIDDPGAGQTQRMQSFDHAISARAPVRAPRGHPPQVDDIAD